MMPILEETSTITVSCDYCPNDHQATFKGHSPSYVRYLARCESWTFKRDGTMKCADAKRFEILQKQTERENKRTARRQRRETE